MKKKQQLIGIIVATMGMSVALPTLSVYACDSVEACQLQLETLQQQNAQVQAELDASKGDLEAAKQRVEQTQNLIFGIDDEISSYTQTIQALEANISQLSSEVAVLQADLEAKDQLLRERLQDLQMKNKVNPYFEFLINSASLNDFIARNEAIKSLNEYDQELMQEVATQREAVTAQKTEIEAAKTQTAQLQAEAAQRKNDQEGLLAQLEVEKKNYETVVMQNEKELDEINLSASVVDEQLTTLAAIQEQMRLEAEQRRLEEEQRRLEEEQAAQNQPQPETPGVPGTPETPPTDNGGGSQVPSQSGFVLPTARGTISCHFLCTDYVNDKGHLGTDIAAATGTPTYAVNDGYVILTKDEANSGGFGNMIAITHFVDGVEMVSVYGHLSSIGVSVGQRVSAGEYIGAVGNTGQSTGPHLHLELLYGIGYMPALRVEREKYAIDSGQYISYPGSW